MGKRRVKRIPPEVVELPPPGESETPPDPAPSLPPARCVFCGLARPTTASEASRWGTIERAVYCPGCDERLGLRPRAKEES